jgi:lichenan operon transcriptional antiterminator
VLLKTLEQLIFLYVSKKGLKCIIFFKITITKCPEKIHFYIFEKLWYYAPYREEAVDMYLHTRQQQILKSLLDKTGSVKGDELAEGLGVSTRTLRSDIKALNEYLLEAGATIISTHNGYLLNIEDELAFREFRKQLGDGNSSTEKVPQENEERVDYLTKRLLMTNDYLKAEDLAGKLFISKSSLTKLLKEVKERLGNFNLTLTIRPNYGLKVEGGELQRRACISEYFFPRRGNTPLLKNNTFAQSHFSKSELENISDIIGQRLQEAGININDIGFENMVIHFLVSVKRIQMGMEITECHVPRKDIHESNEFQVINLIAFDIAHLFEIDFSEEEKLYLTVHLIGNRLSAKGMGFATEEKVSVLISDMLTLVYNVLGIDVRDDEELRGNLMVHMHQQLTRLFLGLRVRNPLIEEIISHFPLAFDAAVIAVSVLEKEFNLRINKDEIGFIAIHLQASMERKNGIRDPKRCLILCGTGKGSAVLLKYKLKDYFGGLLEVVDTIGYYEWKNYKLPSHIDFIISTISTDLESTVPVIEVNHILGSTDYKRIQEAFFENYKEPMLRSVISDDLVFLQRPFETREEVIDFLSRQVVDQGLADDEFKKSVMERETFTPTAFGNLVAIPHPIKNISNQTFLAFCTLPKPITWGDSPVQFVCLFSIKQNNKEDLQYLYDFLYDVLNDKKIINQLIEARTKEEFLKKLIV